MFQKLILLLVFCTSPFYLFAQLTYPGNKSNSSNNKLILQKPGHIYSTYVTKTGKTETKDIDMTEMLDLIVEFKDEPLFIKMAQNKEALQKAAYQNTFTQFSRDLATMNHNSSALLKVSLNTPEIKREYYKVFFGASLKASRALKDAILSLSYVKKIYKDYTVKALADQNNIKTKSGKKIDSDTVTGKGIIVGVIDTGIDYKHPALGGGFGPGFKVIGGYDIINDDADPMDDNGHGTHVAGIIAAKSDSVTGVAPDASLMAFKVLDAGGGGTVSTVLAGIERAVDPNNDGLMDDKVDIVNMSLGGSGGPNDALSTAVDNATSLGVTFCIAAGNSGNYNTIGSPGTAVSAITVGATDENGNVAYFSSKGPDKNNYYIKPEVIAPGVNIYSTYLDSSYATFSGTSMATPYVSGVCALIKSLHPDWSPEFIKSAIVNTADNKFVDVMSQGGGKINKQSSEKNSTLCSPATLNFGLADAKQTSWIVQDTINITNKNSSSQDYNISITGLESGGIILNATPSSFSIPPGASQKIIFNLSVDNNSIPYFETGSRAYYGSVNITGTYDYLHLPWAFIKSPILILKFDKQPDYFFLTNNKTLISSDEASWSSDSTTAEVLAAKGTFNIFSSYSGVGNDKFKYATVINSGLSLNGYDSIHVNSNEAKNTLNFNGINESGIPLSSLNKTFKQYILIFPDSSMLGYASFFAPDSGQFKISDLPDGFSISASEYQSDLKTENIVRLIQFDIINNLNSDVKLTNKTSDYIKQNIHISLNPHIQSNNFSFVDYFKFLSVQNDFEFGMYVGYLTDILTVESNEWDGTLFVSPEKLTLTGNVASIYADIPIKGMDNLVPWFLTRSFTVISDSIGLYDNSKPTSDILFYHNNGRMIFGKGIVYPHTGLNYYTGSSVDIQMGYLSFAGQLNESRFADNSLAEYSLTDKNGVTIKTGLVNSFTDIVVSPGTYNFKVINNNYFIDSTVQAKATLVDKFDFTTSDYNSPMLKSLQIRDSENMVTCNVQKNDNLSLYFSVFDNESTKLKSVEVYAKNYYQDDWQEIPITELKYDPTIGHMYTGDLDQFTKTDTSAIDLKITSTDLAGNSMEYALQPAFVVGKFKGHYIGPYKIDSTVQSSVLYNNYPNPFNPGTNISYIIPSDSYVKIEIYNILGQLVTKIFEGNQIRGLYKFYWDAHKFASGIYFCNFTAKGKVNYQKVNKLMLLK